MKFNDGPNAQKGCAHNGHSNKPVVEFPLKGQEWLKFFYSGANQRAPRNLIQTPVKPTKQHKQNNLEGGRRAGLPISMFHPRRGIDASQIPPFRPLPSRGWTTESDGERMCRDGHEGSIAAELEYLGSKRFIAAANDNANARTVSREA